MAADPLIGHVLVGHRIEERLGEGGMGVVYRARHEQLGKVRALKLLPPELAEDAAFKERFEREWRIAASIEHPHIVEVLDAGRADDRLYILMRLVDGPDLGRLVREEGPLEPRRAVALVEQVALALDAAHDAGLIHRDVTPRNILVADGDRAFLVDFGVARTTATQGITKPGFFVGNLDYAAPEQIDGTAIDGRVDVYALGGVLHTCLTGHAPYERDSDIQLLYAHLRDPPPVPTTVRPGLPAGVDDVVARAMAKDPGERYSTCAELVAALREAVAPEGTPLVAPARATGMPAAVADYKLEAELGRGGMGVVYLAERPKLGSKVALKILNSDLAADGRFRDRFVRESQMASALDHPNIIPVYDAGDADGTFYIAMRYVDGPSLKSLIEEGAPLEPGRALAILGQMASALDTAHAHGLLHRDVKPANVLVAQGGASEFGEHVYLTDFGVSKRLESHSGLTNTGQFLGTLSYAAPEQIEGKEVDHRVDVYALGCVLYEVPTGGKPFERENDVALLWAHVTEPPPRITDARPDLPPELDAVVARAMAKAPGERYGTCRELVDDARAALSEQGTTMAAAVPAATVVESAAAATVADGSPAGATRAERGGARSRKRNVVALVVVLAVAGIAASLGTTLLGSSGSSASQPPTTPALKPPPPPPPPLSRNPPPPREPPATPPPVPLQVRTFTHTRPIAGRAFAVSLAVAERGSSQPLASARVGCPARIAGDAFAGKPSFSDGVATCRWIPSRARAKSRLAGRIAVSSGKLSIGRNFSVVLAAPPERLVIAAGPTYSAPQAGGTFAGSVRFALVDDLGRRRALPTARTRAACHGRVARSRFTPGTTTLSDATGVTCSWHVPGRAAGRPLLIQIVVHTPHGSRVVRVRTRVEASAPTPPPPASDGQHHPQPPPQPAPAPAPQPPPPPSGTVQTTVPVLPP